MNMYLYVCVCTYLVSISYRTFPSPWKISFCPLSYSLSPGITAPPPENCYSDFCHHRLDLPLHKLQRNEVFPYILFCVWLLCLNIMYLRFTHVVASLHNSEFLLLSSITTYEYAICSSILLLMDFWVVSSVNTAFDSFMSLRMGERGMRNELSYKHRPFLKKNCSEYFTRSWQK